MDVFFIAVEPGTSALQAAYRPIKFVVVPDTLCPPEQPMYCDIYIAKSTGSWYYKTITSYSLFDGGGNLFFFDIQDAVQEAIQTFIPGANITDWEQSDSDDRTSYTEVFCKFRGSSYDADGILIPNGPIPVQSTAISPGVDGGGTASEIFYVLNGSILPQLNSIYSNDLLRVLELKQNTTPTVSAIYKVFTLSNLPKTDFFTPYVDIPKCNSSYIADYASLPILIHDWGVGPSTRNCRVYLFYQINGIGAATDHLLIDTTPIPLGTYYLPCGMQQIAALAPSAMAALTNVNNNAHYHIVIWDADAGAYAYVSPKFKVNTKAVERKQLWFQSTYGHFEAVTFARNEETFKTVSSEQFVPYIDNGYPVQTVGRKRFNVRANDEINVVGQFAESLLPWLKELFMSPLVMLHTTDAISGLPLLSPVKVLDDTFQTKKTVSNNRTTYEVSVKVRPAIDYITLRN